MGRMRLKVCSRANVVPSFASSESVNKLPIGLPYGIGDSPCRAIVQIKWFRCVSKTAMVFAPIVLWYLQSIQKIAVARIIPNGVLPFTPKDPDAMAIIAKGSMLQWSRAC